MSIVIQKLKQAIRLPLSVELGVSRASVKETHMIKIVGIHMNGSLVAFLNPLTHPIECRLMEVTPCLGPAVFDHATPQGKAL